MGQEFAAEFMGNVMALEIIRPNHFAKIFRGKISGKQGP
jgi:hypothetical protein